jgi:hypothetical protein
MNFSLLIGTAGALAGVGLGSWLSARAQHALFQENRRQAMRQSQLDACIAFLEAYRKLVRFILIEAQNPLFEERNAADARLTAIISSSSPIRLAANVLNVAFRQLVHARAEFGYGGVPVEIVSGLRAAEDQFSHAVYEQLVADRITENAARKLYRKPSKRLGAK